MSSTSSSEQPLEPRSQTPPWYRLGDPSAILIYFKLGFQETNIIQISFAQKFQNLWPRESSCLGLFWAVSPRHFLYIAPFLLPTSPLSCFAWASACRAHFMNKSPAWAWQPCPNPYCLTLHTVSKTSHGGHANKLALPVPPPEKSIIRSCIGDGKLGILISKLKVFLIMVPSAKMSFSLFPAQENGAPLEMVRISHGMFHGTHILWNTLNKEKKKDSKSSKMHTVSLCVYISWPEQ